MVVPQVTSDGSLAGDTEQVDAVESLLAQFGAQQEQSAQEASNDQPMVTVTSQGSGEMPGIDYQILGAVTLILLVYLLTRGWGS